MQKSSSSIEQKLTKGVKWGLFGVVILAILGFTLSRFIIVEPISPNEGSIEIVDNGDGVLEVVIDITPSTAQELMNALNNNVRKIIITSAGGDVDSSLPLARKILEQKIDVDVKDFCFSSCANYLFTAANQTNILENSIVCIHGSASTNKNVFLFLFLEGTSDVKTQETAFFEKVGIDLDLFRSAEKLPNDVDWLCPSQQMWEAHGANNIGSFWYPESQAALEATADTLTKQYYPGKSLKVIGDY